MTENIRMALSPLFIISYLFGARIVEFSTSVPKTWLNLLYMLILWTVYHLLLSHSVISSIADYNAYHHICFRLNMITASLSIILGLYYDKKFKDCLKKLIIVDDTLKELGIMTDYQKLHTRTVFVVLGWSAVVILIISGFILWFRDRYNTMKAIYVSFMLEYCSHINLIGDLILTSVLGYAGLKFDQINEYLRELERTNECGIRWAWEHSILLPLQSRFQETSYNEYATWVVIHLHLELCKISREINSIFGLQMTLKMGSYFAFIALGFRDVFDATLTNKYAIRKIPLLIIAIYMLTLNIFRLAIINYICETVSVKANATGNIINRISYSTYDVVIRENISQLLLHMNQMPLRFYGFRLFQFGFKFIHMFTASVATVIVILVQARTNTKCCEVRN